MEQSHGSDDGAQCALLMHLLAASTLTCSWNPIESVLQCTQLMLTIYYGSAQQLDGEEAVSFTSRSLLGLTASYRGSQSPVTRLGNM